MCDKDTISTFFKNIIYIHGACPKHNIYSVFYVLYYIEAGLGFDPWGTPYVMRPFYICFIKGSPWLIIVHDRSEIRKQNKENGPCLCFQVQLKINKNFENKAKKPTVTRNEGSQWNCPVYIITELTWNRCTP